MTYPVLKFIHLLGLVLIGAGLIGVWYADLRSRQIRELSALAEAVRSIAVLYDGLVVPGALLLLGSGTWLIVTVYGGWAFLGVPWLIGMVALFAFEFIEGNTITRLYFIRLRRLTREAVELGHVTPALEEARREHVPTFTHFLDIPILFLIVMLGVMRPHTWTLFITGTAFALAAAASLTLVIPRLYPFELGAWGTGDTRCRIACHWSGRRLAFARSPPLTGSVGLQEVRMCAFAPEQPPTDLARRTHVPQARAKGRPRQPRGLRTNHRIAASSNRTRALGVSS